MVCCCGEHYHSATESNAHTQTTDTQPTDGSLEGTRIYKLCTFPSIPFLHPPLPGYSFLLYRSTLLNIT